MGEDDELIGQDRVQEPSCTSRPLPSVPVTTILTPIHSHTAMSSSMDLTRDWLRNVLRPYPARDRILAEVMDILMQRRTLSVKTDAFSSSPPLPRDTHADVQHSIMAKLPSLFYYMVLCPSRFEAQSTISQSMSGSRMNTPVWRPWHSSYRPKRWE